jgi:hypothetical protein
VKIKRKVKHFHFVSKNSFRKISTFGCILIGNYIKKPDGVTFTQVVKNPRNFDGTYSGEEEELSLVLV